MLFRVPVDEATARAARVTQLVLDCDGVLTDGTIYMLPDGEEVKRFNTLDGHGIVLWREAGYKTGIISGRGGRALELRCEQLRIDFLVQRTRDKLASFREVVERESLLTEEIAYMGDDVVDVPVMYRVGLAVAPPNATPETIEAAHVVTRRAGGAGAVRELIDFILKSQKRWDHLMARYRT